MEPGKAKSKSVSLQPELWDRAEAKAARHYGSNRSSYIRALIENEGNPTILYRHYRGLATKAQATEYFAITPEDA